MPATRTFHYPAGLAWHVGHEPGRLLRFVVAVLVVPLALAVRLALDRVLGEEFQPYATTYVAVAIVAWWAGLGPAIVTAALGLFSTLWIIVPPRNSFAIRGVPDLADIVIFLFVATTILVLTSRMRKAKAGLARANVKLAEANTALEGLVRQRTAKLQEAVAELEHFSHALVHDVRAPLRSMEGYAALLERTLKDSVAPPSLDFCRRIRSSAQRLDELVQDSLNYLHVLRGQMPLQPIDLSNFLRGLIESYPDLQAHAPAIRIEGSMPAVLANKAGLTQCFANLLRNALKFVAPGVTPQVLIRAEPLREKTRIWICDNGIGIPNNDQPRIFEMFQRLQPDYEGTGMGLAIVQKAVQRMGGSVGVQSGPGHGSRFWLDLKPATKAVRSDRSVPPQS